LLEDGIVAGTIDSDVIYANQKNGWARPDNKTIEGNAATLMFLQTLSVTREQLKESAKPNALDVAKLKSLKIQFDVGASAEDEIWLDSILFIRK
jgi:hypothetical protein